jgi:hypothetical protein
LIVSHPNDPQHRHLFSADGIRRPFPLRARNSRQRPSASRPAGEEDQAAAPTVVNVNVPPALKPAAALNKPSMWRPRPTRSGPQAVTGFVAGLALMASVYAGFAALTDRPEQVQRPDAAVPAPAAPTIPAPSTQPAQSDSPASRTPSGGPTGRPPAGPAASSGVSPTLVQTPLAATAAVTTKTKKPKKPKKSKAPDLVGTGISAAN